MIYRDFVVVVLFFQVVEQVRFLAGQSLAESRLNLPCVEFVAQICLCTLAVRTGSVCDPTGLT